MIFEITLNGVKVTKDIPTKWEDVKFKDFLLLSDNKELNALSIFTSIDAETLKKSSITNLNALLNALAFLKTEVPLFKYPKSILGYPVRQDLGFDTFGQYSDLKDELDKGHMGMDLIKQYPLMCAIYTAKQPYDFKEAEKNVDEFMNAPCVEVLAVGNFLLMKLLALNRSTAQNSPSLLTRLKNWKLVLRGWLSRLAFTVRYYILKRKLNIN